MKKRVLVFSGPSGGHLFPALAFAEALGAALPDCRIRLVTSRRGAGIVSAMPAGVFERVHYLPEFPFPSGFSLRALGFLLELSRAFFLSFRILSDWKPDLCAGFGSFVSFPGMRLAQMRRIPNFIHEQNVHPGKATRLLAVRADKVAVSFASTLAGLPQAEFTGLPIRASLAGARSAASETFRVLVVGGSQGSRGLNRAVLEAFSRLSPEEKHGLAVTHIAGRDHGEVARAYRDMGIASAVHPFYAGMHEIYGASDLAITRAGANTLFEIAFYRLPAIVVPYPYAGAHQKPNAEYFAAAGGVLLREEGALTPEALAREITRLRRDPEARARMGENLGKLAVPDAAERLADLAAKLLGKESLCRLSTAT